MFYFSTIFYSFLFTNVKFCSIKKRKYILSRIRIPSDLLFANPLTPRSDKHVFSPYNIHTLGSKLVMEIIKLSG